MEGVYGGRLWRGAGDAGHVARLCRKTVMQPHSQLPFAKRKGASVSDGWDVCQVWVRCVPRVRLLAMSALCLEEMSSLHLETQRHWALGKARSCGPGGSGSCGARSLRLLWCSLLIPKLRVLALA